MKLCGKDYGNREIYSYPLMTHYFCKDEDNYKLEVYPGTFSEKQINVIYGLSQSGKSTVLRFLSSLLLKENSTIVSYKPQKIIPKFQGTVYDLFTSKISEMMQDELFLEKIIKPSEVYNFYEKSVQKLSPSEKQKVGIILCLGKRVQYYCIDDFSSSLSFEDSLLMCQIIRNLITFWNKTIILTEENFVLASYLADQIIIVEKLGSEITVTSPQKKIIF